MLQSLLGHKDKTFLPLLILQNFLAKLVSYFSQIVSKIFSQILHKDKFAKTAILILDDQHRTFLTNLIQQYAPSANIISNSIISKTKLNAHNLACLLDFLNSWFNQTKENNLLIITADKNKIKHSLQSIITDKPILIISALEFCEKLANFSALELISKQNIQNLHKEELNYLHRILEIILAFILLISLSPLFCLIGIFIYLESGRPIFYSQKRVGLASKPFWLYKFRSMYQDAEMSGPVWAKIADQRITPLGHYLRAWHLDELPQLWNILIGEMHFIGPRPERCEFVARLKKTIPYYELRHLVKPGLSGWAQISLPYAASYRASKIKLEYDLFYLKHASFWLDCYICLKTLILIFTTKQKTL